MIKKVLLGGTMVATLVLAVPAVAQAKVRVTPVTPKTKVVQQKVRVAHAPKVRVARPKKIRVLVHKPHNVNHQKTLRVE